MRVVIILQLKTKVGVLEKSLNEEKRKNINLLEKIKNQQKYCDMNEKINLGNLNEVFHKNKELSRQNRNLTYLLAVTFYNIIIKISNCQWRHFNFFFLIRLFLCRPQPCLTFSAYQKLK